MNEPTKTEADAEDWLKATSVELCKVADHFLALRQNTMEIVSAATKVNIDASRLEGENIDLRARVKRLEDALDAADKYIDAIQDDDSEYTDWIVIRADAQAAYERAKQAAKESKP